MNKPCFYRSGKSGYSWQQGNVHGWVMGEVVAYGIVEDLATGNLHKIALKDIRFQEPGIEGQSNAGPTESSVAPIQPQPAQLLRNPLFNEDGTFTNTAIGLIF